MVGGTLRELRERIADRHEDGGRYYVCCGRTGERPVPVGEKRFPTRETAVEAADLTEKYRAELRRYDPRVPRYDLVVSEAPDANGPADVAPGVGAATHSASVSDFCHDVAAAVFESLSELDETAVERGAMEAYFHTAESVTDPDELCLVLLSTMAAEIDDRLDPDRQERVLRAAANRLETPPVLGDPMDATLARFTDLSLVGDYAVVPNDDAGVSRDATGLVDGEDAPVPATGSPTERSWTVTVEEYAFDGAGDGVPTLPLAVELFRHLSGETVAVSDLRATSGSGWECVVSTDAESARAVSLAVPENA